MYGYSEKIYQSLFSGGEALNAMCMFVLPDQLEHQQVLIWIL